MKAFRIKKRDQRLPIFIQEVRTPLSRPHFSRVIFFQVHPPITFPQVAAAPGTHSSPLPAERC
jgi:hypothetical protein